MGLFDRITVIGVRVRAPIAGNDPGHIAGRAVLWAVVPDGCAKFYANPEAESAYLDISAEMLAALRAGEVVERVESGDWTLIDAVTGKPRTLESLRPYLEERWQAFQDEVDAHEFGKYGTSWGPDGVWRETGIA